LQMQACRLRSHTVDVTPPQAATKIMREWRNSGKNGGRMAEWRNGGEWQKEWQKG
jgi:hypothetical protein